MQHRRSLVMVAAALALPAAHAFASGAADPALKGRLDLTR